MPKLIIEFQGQEWTVDLREGVNLLGRGVSCTIPIKDPQLSREHCEIRVSGSQVEILDRGSMNGTFVNGVRIQQHRLQAGDRVVLGRVTAWFERKPESPAGSEGGAAEARARTRRAVLEEPPVLPEGLPPDYVLKGRRAMLWGKLGAAAAVLGVLGAAGILVRSLSPAGSGVPEEDRDNLVRRNASFERVENGIPVPWGLRGAGKGSLSVVPQGRTGSCLSLEKSATGDLILECVFGEEFPLARGGGVEASAWVRYDGFSGWGAIKVEWLRSPGGALLAEEFTPPVPKAPGWIPLQASFAPPAEAGAFRVALAAVGRSGRLSFDDVCVRVRPSGPASPEIPLGTHRVAPGRDGTLRIETRGRRPLVHLHARLENLREGLLPQSCARNVSLTRASDHLVLKGKMIGPADFREIDFEETVVHKEGQTAIRYFFPGNSLQQVDRFSLVFTALKVDRIMGIPETPDRTVDRISFRSDEGEVVVEYSDPATVRVEPVRGGLRVTQTFAVEPGETDATFALMIRETAVGSGGDVFEQVAKLRRQRKFGAALNRLAEELARTKDSAVRDRIENDMRQLLEMERQEWAEAQAIVVQALLSGATEGAVAAMEALDRYQEAWEGESYVAKAQAQREMVREVLAAASAEEERRHRLILERARQQAADGRRTLAVLKLRTFLARNPGSGVADEAKEFLKSLSEP